MWLRLQHFFKFLVALYLSKNGKSLHAKHTLCLEIMEGKVTRLLVLLHVSWLWLKALWPTPREVRHLPQAQHHDPRQSMNTLTLKT